VVLYLFKCRKCNHRQEELQEPDEPREATCIECGSPMYQSWDSLGISWQFTEGFDPALGKNFNTQRERDYYVETNNLRRVKS
jgi:putative FmdB family regulatory protein